MFDQDRFFKIASRPNAEDGQYRSKILHVVKGLIVILAKPGIRPS
jgi:hypothetical protein